MTKLMNGMLVGFALFSGTTFANGSLDFTDSENLKLYWIDADGVELERGSSIRTTSDLNGIATSTDEKFIRATQRWIPNENYTLNTSDGTWKTNNGSLTYSISTTDNTNDTLGDMDGELKLTDSIDITGITTKLNECFDIDITFSAGATRYEGEWKDTEKYELWWMPSNWQTLALYTTLDSFMNADQAFLWSEESHENAGFRLNANLADGSGDLVIIDYSNGNVTEGEKIGTWDSSYTLPGQTVTSIKLNITNQKFLNNDADFQFATVNSSSSVVWIGGYKEGSTTWETLDNGDFIGNEIAYSDYMNAMAPYNFNKLVNCDIADKTFYTLINHPAGEIGIQTFYYGNMNLINEVTNANGDWFSMSGTWSVENGVIISDIVQNDINKTLTVDELVFDSLNTLHTEAGHGKLLSMTGVINGQYDISKTDIPYPVSVDDFKGMKVNLTYEESGEPSTIGDLFLFPNMTFSFGDSGEEVGVWKVENGVLMLDSYWVENPTRVETGVETWVFSDATHATNVNSDTITINSARPIEAGDSYPLEFTADAITHPFSIEALAGKVIVVGDVENEIDQDKLFFYANMTYKQETHDDNGNPEIITGVWSVEEGALIIDVVYSDTKSTHYVITDNGDDTVRFMEVVGGSTEVEPAVQKISISNIPSESKNSGAATAVIMYLLN